MNVRVLGPLEASVDGRPLALGAGKPRARARDPRAAPGRDVSTERLIDGPVGRAAARDRDEARAALRLAAAQGAGGERRRRGDRHARARLRAAARARGRRRRAASSSCGARARRARRWRCGAARRSTTSPASRSRPPRSAGSRSCGWRRSSRRSTPTSRPAATARSLAELDALVAEEPLRERLHAQRMLALYRSRPPGRRARGLPGGPPRTGRAGRASSRARSCGACTRRSCARTPRSRRRRTVAEWARADAARRLDAAVGRAASERAELRAAEDEVAGGVEELQAARDGGRCASWPARSRGWRRSTSTTRSVFFGRERLVAELVARLAGAPLMAVVGPSGSGKSSALRAGLLAALAAGVLPGCERWAIALLRPGRAPAARARAGDGGRRRAARWWPSTSSRSCSRPAATSASAPRSSTRWPSAPATRGARRSCWSRCAPTSTATAPPTRSCRA